MLTRQISCLCGLWSPSQSVAWLHQSVRSLLFVTLISAGVSTFARDATAADIIPYSDPVMDCGILVSGTIVEGDAAKLRQVIFTKLHTGSSDTEIDNSTGSPIFIRTYDNGSSMTVQLDQASGKKIYTNFNDEGISENSWYSENSVEGYLQKICFNSLGGSFTEGLKIAQIVGEGAIGTAIAAGHSCESACAMAFMGGAWSSRFDEWERFADEDEDEGFDTDRRYRERTLHPKGRLGFHATALALRQEQYTAIEIDKAYALALDTVNHILRLRANKGYNFPDYVLSKMLETPSSQMYYIDTVEAATRAGVEVAPVAINAGGPKAAIQYVCDAALVSDFESESILSSISNINLNSWGNYSYDWWLDLSRFGDTPETCRINTWIGSETDERHFERGYGTSIFSVYHNSTWLGSHYMFQTHPLTTKIANLPTDVMRSVREFRILAQEQMLTALQPTSCWLTGLGARIVNVDEFVNLRSEPGLNSRIISQVSRYDFVHIMSYMPTRKIGDVSVYGSLRSIGDQTRRDECGRACSAYVKNSSDADVEAIALQCIDENVLWAEVRDRNGNTGWVSRKFLHAAE